MELVASSSFSEVGKNIAATREFDFFSKPKPEFGVHLSENLNSSFYSYFFAKIILNCKEFGIFLSLKLQFGGIKGKKWNEEATNSKLGIIK